MSLDDPDHRFEWTRQEFQNWANGVASRFGYTVRFVPVGSEDEKLGAPTQMGCLSVLINQYSTILGIIQLML